MKGNGKDNNPFGYRHDAYTDNIEDNGTITHYSNVVGEVTGKEIQHVAFYEKTKKI